MRAPALRPPAVPRGGGPPHTGRDPARRPAGGGVRPGVHKKQADAGNLERQKERLLACAALKGYRVVHVFDDGPSGLNQRRRGVEG